MAETMSEALPDLEPLARQLYEEGRKRVSGRPKWEHLNPNCAYDMGMRSTAFAKAEEQHLREASAREWPYLRSLDLSKPVEG